MASSTGPCDATAPSAINLKRLAENREAKNARIQRQRLDLFREWRKEHALTSGEPTPQALKGDLPEPPVRCDEPPGQQSAPSLAFLPKVPSWRHISLDGEYTFALDPRRLTIQDS